MKATSSFIDALSFTMDSVVTEEYNKVEEDPFVSCSFNPDGNVYIVEKACGREEILLPVVHEATRKGKAYSLSGEFLLLMATSLKQSLDAITRAHSR